MNRAALRRGVSNRSSGALWGYCWWGLDGGQFQDGFLEGPEERAHRRTVHESLHRRDESSGRIQRIVASGVPGSSPPPREGLKLLKIGYLNRI